MPGWPGAFAVQQDSAADNVKYAVCDEPVTDTVPPNPVPTFVTEQNHYLMVELLRSDFNGVSCPYWMQPKVIFGVPGKI